MIQKIVRKGMYWWRHGRHKVDCGVKAVKKTERPLEEINLKRPNWSRRKK